MKSPKFSSKKLLKSPKNPKKKISKRVATLIQVTRFFFGGGVQKFYPKRSGKMHKTE